jgi:hypothetical protein
VLINQKIKANEDMVVPNMESVLRLARMAKTTPAAQVNKAIAIVE